MCRCNMSSPDDGDEVLSYLPPLPFQVRSLVYYYLDSSHR